MLFELYSRLQESNRDALQNVAQAAARETELREAICNLEERLRRHNFYELHGQGSDTSEFDSEGGTIAPRRRRDAPFQYREDTSTDDEDDGYRTSPTVSEGQEPGTHSSVTQDLEPSSDLDGVL
jgi:type II secretory pathway component PulJ